MFRYLLLKGQGISKINIFSLTIIIIILGGIGYFAWLNHNDFKKTLVKQAKAEILLIAKSEAQSIESYVTDVQQELKILSTQTAVYKCIRERLKRDTKEGYYCILEDSYKDIERLADALYLIDSKGAIIDASPFKEGVLGQNLSQAPDVKAVLTEHRAHVSRVFESPSGRRVIAILQPVFEQGEFLGLVRAVISIERLNKLIVHINAGEESYAFLIDSNGTILSYPDAGFIGKNILGLLNERVPDFKPKEFRAILEKGISGQEGTDVIPFLSGGVKSKIVDTLIAFVPVHFNNYIWPIMVAMDYKIISAPVNTNARDNVLFAGFVLLVFIILAEFSYLAQKRKAEQIEGLYNKLEKSHSELKATQSLLVQCEKMEVVGRLAGGVAHEVKNPLAIIMQGIDYLKQQLQTKDERTVQALRYMEEAVYRADKVVMGLLDFSSTSQLDKQPENLNSIIDNALLLLKHQFDRSHIEITRDYKDDLPDIKIDKNRIEQVFVNLILNAVQAMPDGGNIKIKTDVVQGRGPDSWVAAKIEDTGTGIPEHNLGSIFDPFFTTKRNKGGTGLGLSIVRNIIEMHGATIEIRNRKDRTGASATVMFRI